MTIKDFYPREFGGLYFAVNTKSSTIHKISETTYDLMVAFHSRINGQSFESILEKHKIDLYTYEKALEKISRSLYES